MKNWRKIAGVLFIAALMAACGEADRTPKGVLGKNEMRDILLDMNYADVFAREQMMEGRSSVDITEAMRDSASKTLYAQILLLHKTDRETFTKSWQFYESHPDRLEAIYKDMADVVRRKREAIDSTDRARNEREQRKLGRTRMDSLFWPSPDSLKLNIF
ncbi:DUF4296 domain-containing protein [Chitinophaga rhizosphaerae]|uniref:DUF4296 domain-containing protein n=1 Tax=Chitinophaga rhizosphaerae TaxID=1864947 RepID=UPI000F804FBF|nr:DUF4296 domain-containing protein [Chitinophaga rhizosphaerae]